MRLLYLLGIMPIAACQPPQPNLLEAVDWTNGQRPCSESNLSFKNGKVAYNVIDGRIELFDVREVVAVSNDAELVKVTAAPAKALRSSLGSKGLDWPESEQLSLLFRVHNSKLSLVGVQRPGHARMEVPTASQANRFDLMACPLSK